jgi:RNA polymerase sigma-70 factor (ECF subfamily)
MAPLLQLSVMEESVELVQPGELQDVEVARQEIKALLWQAVAELPEEAREVYVLRDVEERSGEEVAERLGISLAAMKSRLHRARQALREKLDARLGASAA